MTEARFGKRELEALLKATDVNAVTEYLATLPIVGLDRYHVDYRDRTVGDWLPDHLHWLPVGMDRGNGGRIKLAGQPTNPIAERLVNGMEAIIELARQLEQIADPASKPPNSPREAVERYFGLPALETIPHISDKAKKIALRQRITEVRRKLLVKLSYEKEQRKFSVEIRDEGIGQEPQRIHETLLSLGQTDKADKPYMIGVFGQGGSSTFATSEYSIVLSRRAPELVKEDDGVGWTIVRAVYPKARRDPYFAYLAARPDGAVPRFDAAIADALGVRHGCRFIHIDYDFGGSSSSVARGMYQALNHVLFSPMLPYDLYALKEKPEVMQGTAQRLARLSNLLAGDPTIGHLGVLDKTFAEQPVVEQEV